MQDRCGKEMLTSHQKGALALSVPAQCPVVESWLPPVMRRQPDRPPQNAPVHASAPIGTCIWRGDPGGYGAQPPANHLPDNSKTGPSFLSEFVKSQNSSHDSQLTSSVWICSSSGKNIVFSCVLLRLFYEISESPFYPLTEAPCFNFGTTAGDHGINTVRGQHPAAQEARPGRRQVEAKEDQAGEEHHPGLLGRYSKTRHPSPVKVPGITDSADPG